MRLPLLPSPPVAVILFRFLPSHPSSHLGLVSVTYNFVKFRDTIVGIFLPHLKPSRSSEKIASDYIYEEISMIDNVNAGIPLKFWAMSRMQLVTDSPSTGKSFTVIAKGSSTVQVLFR
ncbi:hypothetical protein V1478_016305 [Vespula squamosa]|uniref:Uncharacterized protein n=1 Tax=Vespula squamosa TaxID=30214 RepID=A0ABD1ZZE6_VESSQ